MYRVQQWTDPKEIFQQATSKPPFGAGFSAEQVKDIKPTKLELWGSSFDDQGEDFCEYRLFNGEQMVASKRVGGY